MITANFVLENQRKVFAVPGLITSGVSRGPHDLIKKGVKMVMSIEDITAEMGMSSKFLSPIKAQAVKGDSQEETKIITMRLVQNETFDEMVKKLQIEPSKLGDLLSFMEMKRYIQRLSTGYFTVKQ